MIRTAAALVGCLAVAIAGTPGHARAGAQTRTVQVWLKPDLAAYTPANGTDSASVDVFDSQDRARPTKSPPRATTPSPASEPPTASRSFWDFAVPPGEISLGLAAARAEVLYRLSPVTPS